MLGAQLESPNEDEVRTWRFGFVGCHAFFFLIDKASSVLQFIHGLRGELHVTWEEGT